MLMDETCNSVDVRQFGAKGDGETDDSAAFQAAVDYLEDKEGRIVYPATHADSETSDG
jgi:polygalacturonase